MDIGVYQPRVVPVIVAVQVTLENAEKVAELCHGKVVWPDKEFSNMDAFVGIKLVTPKRIQMAVAGDYIIMDHDSLFHVESASSFSIKYERIPEVSIEIPEENNNG